MFPSTGLEHINLDYILHHFLWCSWQDESFTKCTPVIIQHVMVWMGCIVLDSVHPQHHWPCESLCEVCWCLPPLRRLWPFLLTALVFPVQFSLLSIYSIYTPPHRPHETGVTSALVFLRSSCRRFVFTGTYRRPVLITITCRGICDVLVTAGLCAVVEVGVVEAKEGGRQDSPLWCPSIADHSV